MSQGGIEFTARDAFELTRLNRALAQLARPSLSAQSLGPMAPDELIGLGVVAGLRPARRKELVKRLWSQKRQLLRQAENIDGWGPHPPVA